MNFDVFFIYKNISKKLPFKLPVGFIIEILIRILCLSGFLYMNSLRLFIPRPSWKQAFPGYAAQFTSKSAAKLVLKDCGKIEVCATQTFMEASFPGVCSAVYLKKCRQTCAERLRED
jgi:hypothetical protein